MPGYTLLRKQLDSGLCFRKEYRQCSSHIVLAINISGASLLVPFRSGSTVVNDTKPPQWSPFLAESSQLKPSTTNTSSQVVVLQNTKSRPQSHFNQKW